MINEIELRLPKGKAVSVEAGSRPVDLLEELNIPEKRAYAANLNGKRIDLTSPITEGGDFYIITEGSEEALDVLRHSTAHAMAQAVMRLFDDVEFAIGPIIEDGFYYDFDLPHQLSTDDFEAIEAEMRKIMAEDLPVERMEMSKGDARELMKSQGAEFKIELLEEVDASKEKISFYRQGDFTDWCRGPHVNRTGKLKSFKLLNVAGAYWRGDERREMLQRIYGTTFFNDKDLRLHLKNIEEAKKRDHRRLGKDLDLFSLHDVAPGDPFWHANGYVVVKEIKKYVDELLFKYGYREINTPLVLKSETWKISGHWEHYRENMFMTEWDDDEYGVKPMNCPGAMTVYKTGLHTYRELPLRFGEWGLVHRLEKKGMMSGLTRVSGFVQDDAHIFCLPEQAKDEVKGMIALIREVYAKFGFDNVRMELSTRPPKSIGTDEMWRQTETALGETIEELGIDFDISSGEGAFYGPKIDFHIKDALKRSWQCGTVQFDMSMPERFGLEYVGADNMRHRPVLLHRTVLGSMERFVGLLIEHLAGKFPSWLAPVQCVVIPISSENHGEYAKEVHGKLRAEYIRAEIDMRDESLNRRIRDAQLKQVPYMLVVGEREVEEGTVAVRRRDKANIGPVKVDDFIGGLKTEITDRELGLTISREE
ncbi:MAG: threonine--tRNA ligase [FCB group bacterium]|nr:threonine--tRNA ligase [FCB group bacterium]